jgi:uncharacterized protein YbbC (DUF1343 family)
MMLALFLQLLLPSSSVHALDYGIDRLDEVSVRSELEGKRLAVLAHAASVDRDGRHVIDLLRSRHRLVKIFTPEHGLRSLEDGYIGDGTDPESGLPVVSLYKKEGRTPRPEDLFDVDVIVMDLQDVGMRYYTYFSTLAGFMKVAAKLGKTVILLDRPNPIGGERVEGSVLDTTLAGHFIAYHTVPTRHGMTLGELALLYLTEARISLPIRVIGVTGWKRGFFGSDFGRVWRASSPALPDIEQVELYALIGALEQFNLSVGRGLTNGSAFRVFGAPWITEEESISLAGHLNALGLAGLVFFPHQQRVTRAIYEGQDIRGIRIELVGSPSDRVRSDEALFRISGILLGRFSGRLMFGKFADLYFGNPDWRTAWSEGRTWETFSSTLDRDLTAFRARRAPFLLY